MTYDYKNVHAEQRTKRERYKKHMGKRRKTISTDSRFSRVMKEFFIGLIQIVITAVILYFIFN